MSNERGRIGREMGTLSSNIIFCELRIENLRNLIEEAQDDIWDFDKCNRLELEIEYAINHGRILTIGTGIHNPTPANKKSMTVEDYRRERVEYAKMLVAQVSQVLLQKKIFCEKRIPELRRMIAGEEPSGDRDDFINQFDCEILNEMTDEKVNLDEAVEPATSSSCKSGKELLDRVLRSLDKDKKTYTRLQGKLNALKERT
ncbi:hypothetical protein BC939DRAFT_531549 [Gamsiella multidivaricata]|uniref:uncharacterized protein n=1 Tax=Gamsiella multidivaricata TaxID=101098 RepID=UPI00222028A1|nr:uncharacterized protein BC939DRAFT_531549 [Gamsiella multidivaricata]KAG0367997.1 hypothetical protein BGZ54_002895 [Gamsiella multidivaricata]KAI7819080.1 hypothetical protein BC939DRAFT_531549 [Gamsiella multidivaricata]